MGSVFWKQRSAAGSRAAWGERRASTGTVVRRQCGVSRRGGHGDQVIGRWAVTPGGPAATHVSSGTSQGEPFLKGTLLWAGF